MIQQNQWEELKFNYCEKIKLGELVITYLKMIDIVIRQLSGRN